MKPLFQYTYSLLVIALLLTASQAGAHEVASSVESDATPTALQQEILREADTVAQRVAAIRGLTIREAIKKGVKDQNQLRESLLDALQEEVSDEEIENESKAFKRLGLFEPDINYKELMVTILTEEVAGYYDRRTGELYVIQSVPLHLQRITMAHEVFHAIQDQHFDLDRMLSDFTSQENSDFTLARMALIEGDATLVMIDFMLHEMGMLPRGPVRSLVDIPMAREALLQLDVNNRSVLEQFMGGSESGAQFAAVSSTLQHAPLLIRELLLFPYFGGLRFVVEARTHLETVEAFNEIYANAPVSTEQILHPHRYFSGDEPIIITHNASDALPEYRLIYNNVLGELQILLMLKTHLSPEATMRSSTPDIDVEHAAEGWGGDRLMVFEHNDGHHLAAHLSTWDSIDDAREFYQAMVAMAKIRYQGQAITNQGKYGESLCFLYQHPKNGAERLYIERWGDMVLYIEGAPSTLTSRGKETNPAIFMLRDHIWQTFERTTLSKFLLNTQKDSTEESGSTRESEN